MRVGRYLRHAQGVCVGSNRWAARAQGAPPRASKLLQCCTYSPLEHRGPCMACTARQDHGATGAGFQDADVHVAGDVATDRASVKMHGQSAQCLKGQSAWRRTEASRNLKTKAICRLWRCGACSSSYRRRRRVLAVLPKPNQVRSLRRVHAAVTGTSQVTGADTGRTGAGRSVCEARRGRHISASCSSRWTLEGALVRPGPAAMVQPSRHAMLAMDVSGEAREDPPQTGAWSPSSRAAQ